MQKIIQYLKDVRSELSKVSWPTRNEVQGATILVCVLSIALSVFVYACDKAMVYIVGLFLKSGM